ncbi:uncharacterized protein LOC123386175 [Felis catus]|uniref:uncharacterized protein LOC123386175 n=1 Tax=Felis catus TaxID=9685 RepID=UPI001D1A2760|nr:uncharacterized protein LOC123386175 [Felis catus]
MPRASQSNQDLQKSQVGICRPKNSFFQSKHSTPKTSHHQTILPYSPSRQSYPANFALNILRDATMPKTFKTVIQNLASIVNRVQNRSSRSPLEMNPNRSRRTWKRKTFLFVTLLPGVWEPGPILRDAWAGRRAPKSPLADTPHRSAPASARRPGTRALTCSRSRILRAARPAQRPASLGPAARQPQPRPHASPRRGALMGLARLTSCLQNLGPQTIPLGRVRRRRRERPGGPTWNLNSQPRN